MRARGAFGRAALACALATAAAAAVCVAAPPSAWAQASAPEIRASVDANVIGVGETLTLTLSAMSSTSMPEDPQPGSTAGFSLVGRNVSPSRSISIINGHMSNKQGINASWVLRSSAVGTYTLGPLSVVVDGKRYKTQTVSVRVVPAGQAPQRSPFGASPFGPSPFGGSPFDPWRSLLDPQADPESALEPQGPPLDPRFALDRARGQGVFLHATVDKTHVVVGEQVTLSIYAYIDTQGADPDVQDAHESTTADFIRRTLQEDDRNQKPLGFANVGGRIYGVRLVRKSALFPLKAGDLEIGPMTLTLGHRGGAPAGTRESERFVIHAAEPPAAGRPPGYAVGDVGRYALSATVAPKTVERGAAVAVTVDLSGLGNVPAALLPPVRPGVEWLEPETREKIGVVSGERFGGQRTFSYVVRIHKEGAVDLGAFTLPYWDPELKKYAVARADLGTVTVSPGAVPAAAAAEAAKDGPPEVLPGLPAPRGRPNGAAAGTSHLADRPWFWWSLGAPPLLWASAVTVRGAARRLRDRARARSGSPEAELKQRVAAAEVACAGSDPKLGDAAIARMLEAASVALLTVNVRGLAGDQIARALEGHGVAEADARAFEGLLATCALARFSPEAGDMADVRRRWAEAQRLTRALRAAS